MIYKALLIFDHAHPIIKVIIKVTNAKKISSFYRFILEIEQILVSQDQKGRGHFRSLPPKNY